MTATNIVAFVLDMIFVAVWFNVSLSEFLPYCGQS